MRGNKEAVNMADMFETNGGIGDIYELEDEEGVKQSFELIDEYETDDGVLYRAFTPYYDNPEEMIEAENDLVILRVDEDDEGEDILSSIDDDEEYDKIGQIFMDRLMGEFDE